MVLTLVGVNYISALVETPWLSRGGGTKGGLKRQLFQNLEERLLGEYTEELLD